MDDAAKPIERTTAALDLAVDKACCILGDKADRHVLHARGVAILEGLGDGLLAGIDMGDLGARLGGVKAGDAGICKQVQHPRPASVTRGEAGDPRSAPAPVRGLFGKESQMPERRRPRQKPQPVIADLPRLGKVRRQGPAATFLVILGATLSRDEPAVGVPCVRAKSGRPHGLRFGTDKAVTAETLELQSVAAVEQLVIRPVGGGEKARLRLRNHIICFGLCHGRDLAACPAENQAMVWRNQKVSKFDKICYFLEFINRH